MTKTVRRHVGSALFILPAMALFLLFTYYPLVQNLLYAFTSWDGYSATKEFVGFSNFLQIFQDTTLGQSVGNTLYLAVALLVSGLALQLGSALVVYSRVRGHKLIKIILYLPAVLSPIVLSFTWIQFLQYPGYLNQFLDLVGLGGAKAVWLSNVDTVKLVLTLIQTLQYVGYGMIFFLTGLNSVPKEIYEAAELDGARGIRKFWYVTLPLIMPSVTVTLFISITGALNTYAIPFALTGGGPNGASTTLTMQIYQRAFAYRQFGYASAIGILFFLLIAAVTGVQLYLTRRQEVEY